MLPSWGVDWSHGYACGRSEKRIGPRSSRKARETRAFRLGWEEARVAKEKLNARGKVTVNAKVTYTPQGGAPPNTESKKINLIRLSAGAL